MPPGWQIAPDNALVLSGRADFPVVGDTEVISYTRPTNRVVPDARKNRELIQPGNITALFSSFC
jgi:hypothetical protein